MSLTAVHWWLLMPLLAGRSGAVLPQPPTPGAGCPAQAGLTAPVSLHHCCHANVFPEALIDAHDQCKREMSAVAVESTLICRDHCIFERMGILITSKHGVKILSWEKIREQFQNQDVELQPIVLKAIDHCRSIYNQVFHVVEAANLCSIDATDFVNCFSRQVFLTCPHKYLEVTTKCKELQVQITRCPEIQVIL